MSSPTTAPVKRPWQVTTAASILLAWMLFLFVFTAMSVPALAKASVASPGVAAYVAAPPILCFVLCVLALLAGVGVLNMRRWGTVFACIVIGLLLTLSILYIQYLYSDAATGKGYVENVLELLIAPSGVKESVPLLGPIFACFLIGPLVLIFTGAARVARTARRG
jgi:hypothetical protein